MRTLAHALNLVLPLLLLMAQHSALAHVVSHLDSNHPPAQEKTLAHLKFCGKCVSAENLTHAAPGPAADALVDPASYTQSTAIVHACIKQALFAYSSRAPPAFL